MTFWMAFRCWNRSNCWNTIPNCALKFARALPVGVLRLSEKSIRDFPISSVPDVGSSSRFTQRSNVDLPQPDGPMIAMTWPVLTARDTPRTAWISP